MDNECLELEVFMESTQVKTGAEGIAQVSDSNEQHAIQVCQSIAAKRINQKLSRVSNRELKRNHKENWLFWECYEERYYPLFSGYMAVMQI